jgi:hypothetical protein
MVLEQSEVGLEGQEVRIDQEVTLVMEEFLVALAVVEVAVVFQLTAATALAAFRLDWEAIHI